MADEAAPPPKTKKIVLFIVLAAAVGFTVFRLIYKPKFRYAGTIEVIKVDISTRVASVISKLDFVDGQPVKKDQLLVETACEDYRIQDRLTDADYSRALVAFKNRALPQAELELYKNKKDQADLNVQWCTIVSPIEGRVLDYYHEAGEWVPIGTKLLTVGDVAHPWAYIYVPQPMVPYLKLGQKVDAILPEMNNKVFKGTVTKISNQAEFTPKNVQTRNERERLVFGIKVEFENPDETLKPGMTVEVELPEK